MPTQMAGHALPASSCGLMRASFAIVKVLFCEDQGRKSRRKKILKWEELLEKGN